VSGGLGSIGGVIATSIFFTIAPEVLREVKDYRMVAYGALLVVVMVFLPEGVAGGIRRVRRWLQPRAKLEASVGPA